MADDAGNNHSSGKRERIRERIRSNRDSGGSSRDGGGSSRDSGGSDSTTADASTPASSDVQLRADTGAIDGESNEDSGGLRLVSGRRNNRRAGSDNGDRSIPGDSGRSDAAEGQLFTESPSLIRVADVLTLDDDGGMRVRQRRTRKPRVSSTKKSNLDEIVFPLKIACDFIFGLPVALGWGAHWALAPEENENLATDIKTVLEAFPSSSTAEFIKAIEKYIPILVLGMTLYQIIRPRVETTRRLLAEKAELEQRAEIERAEEARTSEFAN